MGTAASTAREGKNALIGEVRECFEKMSSVVLVDYKGLNVESATKLRAQFRQAGVDYRVIKNTIVRHALKDQSWAGDLDNVLRGMTALAWSYEDPSAAAKVIKAFRKESGDQGEKLRVKAGVVEGEILDAGRVENELANMPGKDELRGKLLATLQAPLQQFVALLQAPAQNFVYVLSAKKDQEG